MTKLLILLGIPSDRIDAVTFNFIRKASVDVDGTITPLNPSATDVTASTSTLASALAASPTLGSFSVTSTSVVSNGVPSSSSNSMSPALIGGIVAGVAVFIIVGNYLFI